jgi:hypothetical protein
LSSFFELKNGCHKRTDLLGQILNRVMLTALFKADLLSFKKELRIIAPKSMSEAVFLKSVDCLSQFINRNYYDQVYLFKSFETVINLLCHLSCIILKFFDNFLQK